MRALKWGGGVLAVLVVVAIGGALYIKQNPIVLVRVITQLRDPIGPNQPVTWQKGPEAPVAGKRPPNIVVILADDLGYNDLTFDGGGVAGGAVPTPNIDSIASDGVEFTQRLCRQRDLRALARGDHDRPLPDALRLRVHARADGVHAHGRRRCSRRAAHAHLLSPSARQNVPPIDQHGHARREDHDRRASARARLSHVVLGKWHLGETGRMQPDAQGFDEYLGFLPGARSMYLPEDDPDVGELEAGLRSDRPVPVGEPAPIAVRKDGGPRFAPDAYMTDYLADEAVDAIEANRNRPFFMYLAFNAPHTPLQATHADYDALPQIKDHDAARLRRDDPRARPRRRPGARGAARPNGLDENTLVIFTSDNGGANYIGLPDINKPYRGWKMTFFEGGIHAPFFVKWPAALPQGTKFAEPVGHVDIFATAAAAAGAPLPTDRVIDGVDLVPLRRRQGDGSSAPDALLALGPLQDRARRRLEAAGLRAAEEDLALRPEGRSDGAEKPRRCSS